MELATQIESIQPLSLRERFTLCSAPVLIKNTSAMNAFLQFTTQCGPRLTRFGVLLVGLSDLQSVSILTPGNLQVSQ